MGGGRPTDDGWVGFRWVGGGGRVRGDADTYWPDWLTDRGGQAVWARKLEGWGMGLSAGATPIARLAHECHECWRKSGLE